MYRFLLILTILSIILMIFETVYVYLKQENKNRVFFCLLFIAVLITNVGFCMEMLSDTEANCFNCLRISYLGRSFLPFTLFLLIMQFCGIKRVKGLCYFLCVLHAVTYIAVCTSGYHNWYFKTMDYVTTGLFPHMDTSQGFWNVGYAVLITTYLIVGFSVLIYRLIHEGSQDIKHRYGFLITALFLISISYVLELINTAGCYDVTIIGYTIGSLFMSGAIIERADGPDGEGNGERKAKILVVDDASINLMIAEEMLSAYAKVDTAESGRTAIEMVEKNRYDMIFMDYLMPGMDGMEAIRTIRAMKSRKKEIAKYYKNVPVIAFTGDDTEEIRKAFLNAGANDFSFKPIDAEAVKQLMHKWLPKDLLVKD